MGLHKHHIIPKHMGGTDDPSNLIDLTVEEHALAHKELWEKHGKWQDLVAWRALEGQITSDDLRRMITSYVWTGRKHTPEAIEKIRQKRALQPPTRTGAIVSHETREKMRKSRTGKIHTKEAKDKIKMALKGKKKRQVVCPHCNKIGGAPAMKQWHFDNCKERII